MADNIITRAIDRYKIARDTNQSNRLISEIETIVREGINKRIISNNATLPTAPSSIGSSITGRLKKRLAPDRQIDRNGVFINRFNMTDIYSSYVGEGLLKFSADKYTEAMIRNGYYIQSKNTTVMQYLNKRIKEMEVVSGTPFNELVRDFGMSTIMYGNSYIVKHRQLTASSGKEYVRWDGKPLNPMASLYIEDPRKLVLGEGPAGKMRYLRLPDDISRFRLNALNPSLFSLPKTEMSEVSLYAGMYGFYNQFQSIFKLSSRRLQDFIVYDQDEIAHVRYHHIPGEKIAMPPFWPTLNDIDSLRRIEENVELLIYQYGHPIIHGKVGSDAKPGQQEEIRDLTAKLESMESNGFVITDNRALLEMIGAKNTALSLDAYLLYFYRRVLTGLWLSEVAVGIGDTSNRSTANTLDKLSQEKVLELQQLFADAMQLIMIELLSEAGANMNWIIHPSNIPSFIFKPIDIEGKIKMESHTLSKWQSSMITEQEMRNELGLEPLSDAERKLTYNQLVAIPLKEAGPAKLPTNAVSNKVQQQKLRPANQHGKKTGPSQSQNA